LTAVNFQPAPAHWPVGRFGPPGYGVGNGHPFLGLLLFLIIVALVVWALIAITRYVNLQHPHHGGPSASATTAGTSDALKILSERFARGEIDAEEFTKRRDLLLQTP
jgi:putative membrane protein